MIICICLNYESVRIGWFDWWVRERPFVPRKPDGFEKNGFHTGVPVRRYRCSDGHSRLQLDRLKPKCIRSGFNRMNARELWYWCDWLFDLQIDGLEIDGWLKCAVMVLLIWCQRCLIVKIVCPCLGTRFEKKQKAVLFRTWILYQIIRRGERQWRTWVAKTDYLNYWSIGGLCIEFNPSRQHQNDKYFVWS
jgi:hypothetical protein